MTEKIEKKTSIWMGETHVADLYLLPDGEFEMQWTELMLDSETAVKTIFDTTSGQVPMIAARIKKNAYINYILDRFYLPTSERNQESMLDLVGLDSEDLSRYNIRSILFAVPYREYGVSFGLPCSAFASSLGTKLLDKNVSDSAPVARYIDTFSG